MHASSPLRNIHSDVASTESEMTIVKSAQQASDMSNVSSVEPALMHRSLVELPVRVTGGSGSYLQLETGQQILDACGGAAVAIIGHGNKEVRQAIIDQLDEVSYVHTAAYTTKSAEDLAHHLLELGPGQAPHNLEKAYLCGSGSEANDAAMKLARQYFFEKGELQRKYFVSRQQAYHGNTIAAMSASSNLPRKIPYADILLPHVFFAEPAYAYQYQKPDESEQQFSERLIASLDADFQRLGPENIVSFIAEPVVGATSGCVAAPRGYFQGVRRLCDQYGILLHLDEIMCGMGRTGTYFAFEQEDVLADIVTVGKGLGGGYAPIAACLMSKKCVDVLRAGSAAFNHGHTYQAHPLSCASALAVQRILRRDGLVQRCAVLGQLLRSLLLEAFADCCFVGDVRGRGLFWALEFVQDRATRTPFPPELKFGYAVQKRAHELNVALYPGAGTVDGIRGDHVIMAPPYNIQEQDLRKMVRVLKEAYLSQEALVASLLLPK